jgi:hypothetical protein
LISDVCWKVTAYFAEYQTTGHRVFQIFQGNTDLQIAESGDTDTDECEAIVVSGSTC